MRASFRRLRPGPLRAIRIGIACLAAAGACSAASIDPFGQPVKGTWPGKVADEAELRADVAADRAYYGALRPPVFDRYGGLPGSGRRLGLAATGFFHVEKHGERWLLADPDGNAFFHLGVCGLGPGDTYTVTAGREADFAWLPPADGPFHSAYREKPPGVFSFYLANTIRKYGVPYDPDAFAARMIDRLRKWGFNSVGAFSPLPPAVAQAAIPYVSHLRLDAGMGLPSLPGIANTWDPFEEGVAEKIDRAFAASVAPRAGDPLLIGWFLSNEPLYEDIPKVVPGLKADHACKRALVGLLREKYGTVAAFNAAWGAQAASFDALGDAPLAATTRAAAADLHAFAALFHETYYRRVTEAFRKHDARHHLLIGNRLQPGTAHDEQLCRIAGRYLDVMSVNYYTDALDAAFLKRIADWTGRPLMLSEFYWSAADAGLSGGRAVATQRERGLAYRNYVEQAAALGSVVGIEWFQLLDEAADGRWFEGPGGERANCGLLSVADRPYREMLAGMMETNYGIYDVWLGRRPPYAFDMPRFHAGQARRAATAPRATGPVRVDGATAHWPGIPAEIVSGDRLASGVAAEGLEATFKLCWDDARLYVLARVADPTPLRNTRQGGGLWSGDGIELFLGAEEPGEGGALRFTDRHFLLGAPGAGSAPVFEAVTGKAAPEVEAVVVPETGGYTLEAAIPWAALGVVPRAGLELRFDLAVADSADGVHRRAQLMWSGTDRNSGDRTHWGSLRLLP